MNFTLTSPNFTHDGEIGKEFTCEGSDHFPGLEWHGAPAKTQVFVLICDDPDVPEFLRHAAPDLVWDHLVLVNIPSNLSAIPSGPLAPPQGSFCATNSWGKQDYGGPCPPNPQHHRYFFTLYALDSPLNVTPQASKNDVLKAMEGHILDKTVLIGRYLKEAFRQ